MCGSVRQAFRNQNRIHCVHFVSCFQFNSFRWFRTEKKRRKRKWFGMLKQNWKRWKNANQLPVHGVYHGCRFGIYFIFRAVKFFVPVFIMILYIQSHIPMQMNGNATKTIVASHNIVGARISFAIRIVWRRYSEKKFTFYISSPLQYIVYFPFRMYTVYTWRTWWKMTEKSKYTTIERQRRTTKKSSSSLNEIDKRGLQMEKGKNVKNCDEKGKHSSS